MPGRESPLQSETPQGTLDRLVLRVLVTGAAHGHTIAHAIECGFEDVLQIEHGSLYPAARASPVGEPRLDCLVLGHVRQQPEGEVLPAHTHRPQATVCPDGALGRARPRSAGSSSRPPSRP